MYNSINTGRTCKKIHSLFIQKHTKLIYKKKNKIVANHSKNDLFFE
uniref:Uncharacterized protein n=1 Tax=Anguilla anguilla TaxID=7936 RepID=A0A0E9XHX8_ANGAN